MDEDDFRRVSAKGFGHLFPRRQDGRCRCGCQAPVLPPRRSWASAACIRRASFEWEVFKGRSSAWVRWEVWRRDHGICRLCGGLQAYRGGGWEVHHVVAVAEGGGRLGLPNLVVCCKPCHRGETTTLRRRLRAAKG